MLFTFIEVELMKLCLNRINNHFYILAAYSDNHFYANGLLVQFKKESNHFKG